MPSGRIRFCYIVIGTELKEKHILEQEELFSSGLKEKKHFMWLKWRNVEKEFVLFSSWRSPYPFLLLGDPRLLINLRIDSLNMIVFSNRVPWLEQVRLTIFRLYNGVKWYTFTRNCTLNFDLFPGLSTSSTILSCDTRQLLAATCSPGSVTITLFFTSRTIFNTLHGIINTSL